MSFLTGMLTFHVPGLYNPKFKTS